MITTDTNALDVARELLNNVFYLKPTATVDVTNFSTLIVNMFPDTKPIDMTRIILDLMEEGVCEWDNVFRLVKPRV
jgi:hypothetical protein